MKRSAHDIAADVEMGLSMHGIMDAAKRALEEISERLRADALAHADEHTALTEESREGAQWKAPGGLVVILTADKLVSQIKEGTELEAAARLTLSGYVDQTKPFEDPFKRAALSDMLFDVFFKPWKGWERAESDGLAFRELVKAHMPDAPEIAAQFIDALKSRDRDGMPQSDIKPEWKALATARAAEATAKQAEKLARSWAKLDKKGAAK